jgi:branched-chain amino acid transport system ATP-binding protein
MGPTLLQVRDLCAGYGASQVLDGISFQVGVEAVAVIGRNGMGKTTLCNTIMGLVRATSGEIDLNGERIESASPEKIARSGVSYVPQGRRLFPSLTVDEHLKLVAGRGNGRRWNAERIYETFPRLADRKGNGAAQLSGGEQQMLAIARALLLNPRLLIMDEPSEGLAPAVVESLLKTIRHLQEEGTALLVVEQKLGVATALAERQLVMVAGRIAAETTAAELEGDPEAQQRYLGVVPTND